MRWYMLNHKGIILQLQMEYFQAKIIVDFFFIFELQKKPNQNKKKPQKYLDNEFKENEFSYTFNVQCNCLQCFR